MKHLFLVAFLVSAFSSGSLALNSELFELEEVLPTKYTVYGQHQETVISITYNPDGSSTSKIEVSCGGDPSSICYTVETSADGLTELDPNEGNSIEGILIFADKNNHRYELQSSQ